MTLDPIPIAVRAIAEFAISRRVAWEDSDEVRRHIDAVVDALHGYEESTLR